MFVFIGSFFFLDDDGGEGFLFVGVFLLDDDDGEDLLIVVGVVFRYSECCRYVAD
jgi:hypothetical protein